MRFSSRLCLSIVPRGRSFAALGIAALAFGSLTLPGSAGCLSSTLVVSDEAGTGGEGGAPPAVTVAGDDPSQNPQSADSATTQYRDINSHPGCSVAGLGTRAPTGGGAGGPYIPADIPGYKCAAKAYPIPNEDKSKPVLLLIHGNSDAPTGWEAFPAGGPPMLAETASAAGFRVFAIDFRIDLVPPDKDNAASNIDHGWTVPIAEQFFDSIFAAFPDRKVSIVGFSLGPTVIRDALRRLHRAKKKPFEHIKDLVLCAGSNHGVSTFRKLCGPNKTMAGIVACELGDRTSYTPTDFLNPLNGPSGAFETPCRDGDNAFGQKGVCGGNKVRYTTIVMHDKPDGSLQDEFVSQSSALLNGATNLTVSVGDPDVSKYFYNGLFANHYGAVRSAAALTLIMNALTAP